MSCTFRSITQEIGSAMKDSLQRKKSVKFSPNVFVYRTKHINDFTDEEIHNTWYNDREMRAIVSDCVNIISTMKGKYDSFTSSTDCFRGLEYRTPQGQKTRASNRFCAIDAVLEEQDIQWECKENDTDKISNNYMLYSKPSQAEAHRIGLEDEKEAMITYREGNSCCLESLITRTPKEMSIEDQFPMSMKLQHMKFLVNQKATINSMRNISLRHYGTSCIKT